MKWQMHKRRLAGLFLMFAFVSSQGVALLSPRSAYAQMVVANPDLIAQNISMQLGTQITENVTNGLVASVASQLVNLMIVTVNQLAYQSAVWVASGGPGETPLFTNEQAKYYAQYAGASVAASALDYLKSDSIGQTGILDGFNVVVPDDAEYLASIRQGIRDTYVAPRIDFNFSEVSDNYLGFLVNVQEQGGTPEQKTSSILYTLSQSMRSNEFSSGLKIYSDVLYSSQQQAAIDTQQLIANDGFVAQRDPITGQVTTPAGMVRDELARSIERSQSTPFDILTSMLSGGGGGGGVGSTLLQIGSYAGSVFVNTLASELMKKFYAGLFEDLQPLPDPFNPDSLETPSRQRAQQVFRSLLTFTPIQVSDYNMLSQLASCPTSIRGSRQLFSCAIDTSFASAVNRSSSGAALTLREAIEDGYVKGDWALIPSGDIARNQDSKCYTYAFCYANLVKLRKARIIPVGWELAAESPANSASNPVTLKEVMDAFHSCNAEGKADEQYPWCHLIDPNWVLKAPDSQCRNLAYGELLTAPGTDTRAQTCVDIQTCIAQDANGNCTGGYGYCVREKNTWQFRGDVCPAQYASCLSLASSTGAKVDYLTNTVDYGDCDENSVGCTWYSTTKTAGTSGSFEWPNVGNLALADTNQNEYKNRIYLTDNAESCNANDAGCSEIVERRDGLSLNLVRNSGFEIDNNQNNFPDGWQSNNWGAFSYDTQNGIGRSTAAAVSPGSAPLTQYGLRLNQGRSYTLSFYAKQASAGASGSITARLDLFEEFGGQTIDLRGLAITSGCSVVQPFNGIALVGAPAGTDFERFTCTFTTPLLTNSAAAIDAQLAFSGSTLWIDDVQLEQTVAATSYHLTYSGDARIENVKLPPEYLGCTGSPNDPAECANYARICEPGDAGCTAYTPTNGDPTVTGIVSTGDLCPAVCAGYDTYKQEPTRYEPNGAFPLYFIPSTAETCRADAVGCSEFTNLSNERKEYYTYLRSCLTPDQAAANGAGAGEAVYYTWEGSDEIGFQLKTWHLLESNADAPGYANTTLPSGFVEARPGAAPCTNFQTTAEGTICIDDADSNGAIDSITAACDEHSDIFVNPDCREFYDAQGDIHYRLWSETVTVTNECVAYRKTEIAGFGTDGNNDGVDDGAENCTAAGGYFDAATAMCRFFGYAPESEGCSARENGCREYTGGRARNSRTAFEELFEGGSISSFEATVAAPAVALSNDSIATSGHSLVTDRLIATYLYDHGSICETEGGCPSSGSTLGGSCIVSEGERYCGTLENDLFNDKTYTLVFWAKGTGRLSVGFDVTPGNNISINAPFLQNEQLSTEWRRYSVGPIDASMVEGFGEGTRLVFNPTGTLYLDTISLREGEQNLFLIANSWNTPAICDVNAAGQHSPQYNLGCSEYGTSTGALAYVRTFSRLCDEDDVGCKAYYRTYESDDTFAEVHNAVCENVVRDLSGNPAPASQRIDCYLEASSGVYNTNSDFLCTILPGERSCLFSSSDYLPNSARAVAKYSHINYKPSTHVVPADTDIYAIVNQDDRCSAGGVGCTEVGKFVLAADHSVVESWQSQYIINDPSDYAATLCTGDQLFCDAFTSSEKGVYYFKNPMGRECEYKTDVMLNGTMYDGWFVKGTSEFCYGTGACSDDASVCSTDADCRIETGNCSVSGAACSNDAQCGGGQRCEGVSTATCNITTPSYVIAGDQSGIWRNGDAAYAGWVGVCTPQFNLCSEFQDPLDHADNVFYGATQGTSHYFIDNNRLQDNGLLSSSRCNGRVSQEEGCVLFDDTSDTTARYNASATYIASRHADQLFGQSPFSLVNPIDCSRPGAQTQITMPNGQVVDLCAQRCAYQNIKLDEISGASFGAIGDVWTFGGSCLANSDCAPYASRMGNTVSGSCVTQVKYEVSPGGEAFLTDVPRLLNDTNRVLKVNRDRVCSEWLTADNAVTVWDEGTGQYRQVSSGVDLCTRYSGSGDSSFCSQWNHDDAAVILDASRYVSRDISWYGEEYSGYAVPGIFPVQYLDQVNITPPRGICVYSDPNHGNQGDTCTPTSGCPGGGTCTAAAGYDLTPQYRLGYNAGETTVAHGQTCTIGFCTDNGAPCSDSSACSAGATCAVGACYAMVAGSACSADADCDSGQSCIAGSCAVNAGACGTGFTCGGGATCVVSPATKTGTSYNGQCVLTAQGNTFTSETAQQAICRAFPESTSPFPNRVVEEWSYLERGTISEDDPQASQIRSTIKYTENDISALTFEGTRGGVLPANTINGFERVSLCAAGEVCECSYTKVQTASQQTAYIDNDTSLRLMGNLGICRGGAMDGAFCLENWQCGNVANGARCESITREDTYIGQPGYCLEWDTAINVYGDQQERACLTWLPVDQLAGSTDLYAKFIDAGYTGGETQYCAYVAPYADLKASRAIAGTTTDWSTSGARIACTEDVEPGDNNGFDRCVNNATFACPTGHYALVGAKYNSGSDAVPDGDTDTFAYYCRDPGAGQDNDCPFVCVPNDAVTSTGLSCRTMLGSLGGFTDDRQSPAGMTVLYYSGLNDGGHKFNQAALAAQDCTARGIEIKTMGSTRSITEYGMDSENNVGNTGWYDYYQDASFYLACKDTVLVDDGKYDGAAPYTDRLLGPNSEYALPVNEQRFAEGFAYTDETPTNPYGRTISPTEVNAQADPVPPVLAACRGTGTTGINAQATFYFISGLMGSCSAAHMPSNPGFTLGSTLSPLGSFVAPQARALINAVFYVYSTQSGSLASNISLESVYGMRVSNFNNNNDIVGVVNAIPVIENLFARAFGRYSFNDGVDGSGRGRMDLNNNPPQGVYNWDRRRAIGNPPQVWSIDTANCNGTKCEEGTLNRITVNDREAETFTADEFFRANVKFYMAADKEQLPIRRVIVDWGDNSTTGSDAADNFFKNHRGLVDGSRTQSYCDTAAEWGMTVESCDPNYMNYTHTYSCTRADVAGTSGLPVCSAQDPVNCRTATSCVFQPKVHVRDNWGWCTGTCSGGGCFESNLLSEFPAGSQCNYKTQPDFSGGANDPWVHYGGTIVITP